MKRRLFRSVFGRGPTLKVLAGVAIGCSALMAPGETENAVANGDTRTIQLYHVHTKESISATYLVNGSYDQAVLDKLNWFLRDWRRDEPTKMDPRLFDTIWEVYRESGSRQPIEVMSAYRSPETNAMLRRRTRGVAEHSQHILGKAMDQHYFDVPMSKIREIAMRLQRGGVGFYPTAGTPFVHMDVGGVRHWPRMSYDQLARLFPDGKTVHLPSNGQPLPGYEEARAELQSRGDGSYPTATEVKSKGLFAWLFGSGDDEQEDAAASRDDTRGRGASPPQQRVASAAPSASAPAAYGSKSGDTMSFLQSESARSVGRAPAQPVVPPAPAAPPPAAPAVVAESPNARLALAMSMQQAEAPQPYETAPAPTPQSPAPQAALPQLALSAATMTASGLSVPLPPTRPTELASIAADLPIPPIRPSELNSSIEPAAPTAQQAARLAKADRIGSLLAMRGNLPSVITQGTGRGARTGSPMAVMAYAAQPDAVSPADSPVPMPVPRPADLVSARLDRSNFRGLTSSVKAEKSVSRSAMGSSVVGIRAAARAASSNLAAGSASASFGATASDLATDSFSGTALRPDAKLVTAKRAQ